MRLPPVADRTAVIDVRSRRALLVYLVAIVVPTLILLLLGVQTVRGQRKSIESLSEANRRWRETAVADAVEQRVSALAEACLDDRRLVSLTKSRAWSSSAQVHAAGQVLEAVARGYPIAGHVFIFEEGEVRVPRVGVGLPANLDTYVELGGASARSEIALTFHRAEALENEGRFGPALAGYQRVHAMSRTEEVKALALSRIARCDRALGRNGDAVVAYAEIAERLGSVYVSPGRPHALVAGVELARLAGPGDRRTARMLAGLRDDLLRGRWDLSADEAEYFLQQLGAADVAAAFSPYLDYVRLARAVGEQFLSRRPVDDGGVHAEALSAPARPLQLIYRVRDGVALVLVASTDAVRGDVLAATLREMPRSTEPGAVASAVQITPAGQGGTRFRTIFPFLEVSARPRPQDPSRLPIPDALLFPLATLLVLVVLVLSVILLTRDVARQAVTSRLRADLVGGVSHDLKTPLAVIRMYAETLAGDPDAAREERRSYYDVIIQESERLARLVERVLDFSRLDRGLRQYDLRRLALVPLVNRVVDRYRPYLVQQGFSLEVDCGEDVPGVEGDEAAVSQGLLSLLENAVKYSDEDRRLAVRVMRHDHGAAIEVEDHGTGIAPEDRERVFDRFSRGTRTRGRGGYGLGLFLVKHLMDAHRGKIQVESTPGGGSLFRLVFPAAPVLAADAGGNGGDRVEDPGR